MKHLTVGIFIVSIIILSVRYKIVKIDLNPLFKNAENIVIWIFRLMLGAIISSWLR